MLGIYRIFGLLLLAILCIVSRSEQSIASPTNLFTTYRTSDARVLRIDKVRGITISAGSKAFFAEFQSKESIQGIQLKSVLHLLKMELYDAVFLASGGAPRKDVAAATEAFRSTAGKDATFMVGIEFSSSDRGRLILCVLPIADKLQKARCIIESSGFANAYQAALSSLSVRCYEQGDYGKAIDKLTKLAGVRALIPEEKILQGFCAVRLGNLQEAREIASSILKIVNTLSADTAEKLGDLLFEVGQEKDATFAYGVALRISDSHP